jgi:hypothetical protein
MPLGQAFAVAFGLAFAVFGFLYIVWRSGGRDKTASILRGMFTALRVGTSVGAGTLFLLMREPNVLIGVGAAILFYTDAFKNGFVGWHHRIEAPSISALKAMLRIHSLGNLVSASLCGIGCVIYGGPIGVLGAFAALYWALLHLWVLKRVTADEAGEAEHPMRQH